MSSTAPRTAYPALLTRTSIRPKRRTTSSVALATEVGSVTSSGSCKATSKSESRSRWRAVATTVYLASVNRRARSWPIPVEQPVMRTIFDDIQHLSQSRSCMCLDKGSHSLSIASLLTRKGDMNQTTSNDHGTSLQQSPHHLSGAREGCIDNPRAHWVYLCKIIYRIFVLFL